MSAGMVSALLFAALMGFCAGWCARWASDNHGAARAVRVAWRR